MGRKRNSTRPPPSHHPSISDRKEGNERSESKGREDQSAERSPPDGRQNSMHELSGLVSHLAWSTSAPLAGNSVSHLSNLSSDEEMIIQLLAEQFPSANRHRPSDSLSCE